MGQLKLIDRYRRKKNERFDFIAFDMNDPENRAMSNNLRRRREPQSKRVRRNWLKSLKPRMP